jgi:phage-related protein
MYESAMRFKQLEFRGGSLADLRAFPAPARREAGFQLDRVQNGNIRMTGNQWRQLARA